MNEQGRGVAACGNGCAACPRYTATLSDDALRLGAVAELWHRLGWRDRVVSADEIKCAGCSATQECRHEIAACAAERRVATCGGCADNYTCSRLAKALKRSEAAARSCAALVDDATYETLHQAFFRKRENLAAARRRS